MSWVWRVECNRFFSFLFTEWQAIFLLQQESDKFVSIHYFLLPECSSILFIRNMKQSQEKEKFWVWDNAIAITICKAQKFRLMEFQIFLEVSRSYTHRFKRNVAERGQSVKEVSIAQIQFTINFWARENLKYFLGRREKSDSVFISTPHFVLSG